MGICENRRICEVCEDGIFGGIGIIATIHRDPSSISLCHEESLPCFLSDDQELSLHQNYSSEVASHFFKMPIFPKVSVKD